MYIKKSDLSLFSLKIDEIVIFHKSSIFSKSFHLSDYKISLVCKHVKMPGSFSKVTLFLPLQNFKVFLRIILEDIYYKYFNIFF